MAIDAGDAALQVGGAAIVVLLMAALVAIQAASADLRRRGVFKGKDFRYVPAAVHVLLARTVAGFATVPFGTRVRVQLGVHRGGEMRRACEAVIEFLVTGFAGVWADVQRRVGGTHVLGLLRSPGLLLVVGLGSILRMHGGRERHRERKEGDANYRENSLLFHAAPSHSSEVRTA